MCATSCAAQPETSMSDPLATRLKIVMALVKEDLCTFDIAQVLGITESAVSHQLRLLKTLRLVKHHKEGKMVFYLLDDKHIEDATTSGQVRDMFNRQAQRVVTVTPPPDSDNEEDNEENGNDDEFI